MKNVSIIALALVAASSAFAGEADFNLQNRTPFVGSMTRAEVKADLDRAIANGQLPTVAEADASVGTQQAQAPRDRDEVRAEAVQAARTYRVQEAAV